MSTTAVRERPILFSGPMVRAILDGRKTVTRRVIVPQPMKHPGGKYEPHDPFVHNDGVTWGWMAGAVSYTENDVRCPYGAVGDRLWVRETWAAYTLTGHSALHGEQDADNIVYRADGELPKYCRRWRPSIHMPRWASRITLEITGVRVERLQAITEADAICEGVDAVSLRDVPRQATRCRRDDFAQL